MDLNPLSAMEATSDTHVRTQDSHTKLSSTEGHHARKCTHIHTIPICIHRGMRRRALNGHTLTLTPARVGNWLLLLCSPLSNVSHTVHEFHSQCRSTTLLFSFLSVPAGLECSYPHVRHSSNSYCISHLFILNNKIWITLIIIKDNKDLWVHPVIHARVEQVT